MSFNLTNCLTIDLHVGTPKCGKKKKKNFHKRSLTLACLKRVSGVQDIEVKKTFHKRLSLILIPLRKRVVLGVHWIKGTNRIREDSLPFLFLVAMSCDLVRTHRSL